MAKYQVETDSGKYLVETEEGDSQPLEVKSDKKSFSLNKEMSSLPMLALNPQFYRGLAEGGSSLIPSGKVIARGISPILPQPFENIISPVWDKVIGDVKSAVSNLPEEETNLVGKLARGGGQLLPTLLPMGKGARAIEALPTLLRREGLKIPTLAGKGILKTILRPAVGLGGYEGAKASLTNEEVSPAIGHGLQSGAIFGPASRIGTSLLPGRIGSALGGALGGALTSPEDPLTGAIQMAGLGAFNPGKPINIEKGRIKIASRVVNSLIQPTEKDLRIGNAGRGISREGIWDWSLEGLKKKSTEKLNYLNEKLNNLYNANRDKTDSYDSALKPLYELQRELKAKKPTTERNTIDRIEDILKDLVSNNKFTDINPSEARQLKQEITAFKKSEFEKKTNIESGPNVVEKALTEVYRNIDRKLDKVVEGSAELNTRVTDLIDATDILDRQTRSTQRKPLLPGGSIWNPNTYERMLPPIVKSGMGTLIAPRYKKLIPTESGRGSL